MAPESNPASPSGPPSLSLLVVLVNYNGTDTTIDCLRTLAPELAELPSVSIVVCDNGSRRDEADRLASYIASLYPAGQVAFTSISPNRGFTGGNNAVLRPALESDACPDAFLLLNNDTLVRAGAIGKLLDFLAHHPRVGVCGCRLEYPDGESQLAARRFPTVISEFESRVRWGPLSRLLRRWAPTLPEQDLPRSCGWLPGAALAVRSEVLHRIGLLDEDFFTYFEDVDFCRRASLAGWPAWYVPASRIVHLVGQTTGVTDRSRPRRVATYWFDARRHYFLKHHGPWYAAAADAAALAGLLLWRLKLAVTGRANTDPPQLLFDTARNSVFVRGFRRLPARNPTSQAAGEAPARRTPIHASPTVGAQPLTATTTIHPSKR